MNFCINSGRYPNDTAFPKDLRKGIHVYEKEFYTYSPGRFSLGECTMAEFIYNETRVSNYYDDPMYPQLCSIIQEKQIF